jgi:hypothetical protein
MTNTDNSGDRTLASGGFHLCVTTKGVSAPILSLSCHCERHRRSRTATSFSASLTWVSSASVAASSHRLPRGETSSARSKSMMQTLASPCAAGFTSSSRCDKAQVCLRVVHRNTLHAMIAFNRTARPSVSLHLSTTLRTEALAVTPQLEGTETNCGRNSVPGWQSIPDKALKSLPR